jgi:hypothetical protein
VPYRVIRRLGRGGMGVVDLAEADDGSQVALKRLSLHGTPDDVARARARIRREAEVLATLDHPGIVRLLDVVDEDDDVVLVMPYLSGGSLHDRVAREGPLDPDVVAVLADRLLDALAAAHRQGIVHRDVKPENVLFTGDGEPRLVDFGVARTSEHTPGLTATATVVGTPSFMAPEQARGEPASPASDVFSLGATLLFAVTGQGPYGPVATDPRVLMHRAASGRVERPPRDLPPALRTVLDDALDPKPARRPSAALLRGGSAGTEPRATRSRRDRRRRGIAVGAAAGLALAVVAAGVLVGRVVGDDDAPSTTSTTAPRSTTAPCRDLPFQPCEDGVLGDPAPGTDGRRCLDGFADYDEDPENGCEAEEDGLPDPAELTADQGEAQGTIVPRADADVWILPADDGFDVTCSGRVTVTLEAPAGMVLEMTVTRDDGNVADRALAEAGRPAVVEVGERCGSPDGDLTVEIRAVGSDRTGDPYTLRRDGSF